MSLPVRAIRRTGTAALILAVAMIALAQPPAKPAPPNLNPIVPCGMTRGTTLEITLSGTNLADPITLGTTFPARVTAVADSPSVKDSTKSRWKLDVPADSPIGWHRIWLETSQGLSNFRPFCIDSLPQVLEIDGNRSKDSAQTVPVPCVVVGRVNREQSGFFRFTVAAGQRLSFEVLGRRLGSALDPFIRLHDAKSGRELPRASSDDSPGLQTDARLTSTFAAAGEHLVEIRDTTYRGGPDFHYRLRIGDFPCVIAPVPLAARRGSKLAVNFTGPQIAGAAPIELQVPTDPAVEAVSLTPVGPSGVPGWPVTLLVSDFDEVLAPNPMPKEGTILPVPGGVTSIFLNKSQLDTYRFAAKKGQKYVVAVQTTELLSPAEVYLTLRDPKGGTVANSDPQKSPRIDLTAADDGEFSVAVEHLNYAFGPTEIYRLTVTQPTPGFDLTLGADRVDLPQGQVGLIPIQTLARRDYPGPIELTLIGPKGLSGSLPVSPAAESGPLPGPGQPSGAAFAMLPIRADASLAPGVYEVQVQAKATIAGKETITFASTGALVSQAMGGLPFPPRTWQRSVAVAVLPKPPFELAAKFEPPEAVRGLATTLVVTAKRDEGFDGPITVSATGLPANVTAANQTIESGKTEVRLEVKLKEQAAMGSYAFTVRGRAKQADRDSTATLLPPPLTVVLPFELKVAPTSLTINQGEKAVLTVSAVRKGGYNGPIGIELRNLPAQVTAAKTSIPPNQSAATIELSAAPAAPLGARGDVDVLGTITLGQQASSSPPFAVKVQAPPPPPMLALKVEPATVTLKPGDKTKIKVAVERKNFAGPVVLTMAGLPAKVTVGDVTVTADQNSAEIELSAAADADTAMGKVTITGKNAAIAGTVKFNVVIAKDR